MNKISLKTKLALVITLVLWASAFVGIRAGLVGYSPGVLALFRFLIASACLWVIYLYLPITRNKINKLDAFWLLLLGAISVGGYHLALNTGELSVASGTASFIISQSPIVTTALAILFLRERLNWGAFLGMAISIFGVTLIMLGQDSEFQFDSGNLYILAATFVGSIYMVLQKPFLKKYHAIEVTAFVIWGATLPLLFYIPGLSHEIVNAPLSATLSTVYLGIFPAAIAYATWSYVLAEMPASRAANFMYFMPIIATLLGWVCLNEVPTWTVLFGGIVALLGVWLVNESHRGMIRTSLQTQIQN